MLVLSALLYSAGCAVTSPGDPPDVTAGPAIASYRLTAEDDSALPCCGVVGGRLRFYGPGSYTDTAYTPGGVMSRACVHEVPNGSNVNMFTYVVTLPDSTRYLLLPCDRGTYLLTLIQSNGDTVPVSSGTFTAKPDTIDLADAAHPGSFTASVTVPTILVTAATHRYRFAPDSSLRLSTAAELPRVLHDE